MISLTGKSSSGTQTFLLPFSPSLDRWTDDHYSIYSLVELQLGNRKEVSQSDREDMQKVEEIDKLIESGDPDWLKKVEEYFSEGYDINEIPIDEDFVDRIEAEENFR
jgi:hypothetical protein